MANTVNKCFGKLNCRKNHSNSKLIYFVIPHMPCTKMSLGLDGLKLMSRSTWSLKATQDLTQFTVSRLQNYTVIVTINEIISERNKLEVIYSALCLPDCEIPHGLSTLN